MKKLNIFFTHFDDFPPEFNRNFAQIFIKMGKVYLNYPFSIIFP